MSTRPRHSRNERLRSWLLVLALTPMLTFMGHWPTSVPIPGTDMFVSVPLAGQPVDSEEREHSHGQHCHGDSDRCGEAPSSVGVGLGLPSTPLLSFGATGMLFLLALLWWHPANSAPIGPELRPPRRDPLFA